MSLSSIVSRRALYRLASIFIASQSFAAIASEAWFEALKSAGKEQQLYRLLYAMPKGGDLHNHNSGSNFSEWWYELATDKQANGGYQYYTKISIQHCNGYGTNEFGPQPSLMLFRNIQHSSYEKLNDCQKSEYLPLEQLSAEQKDAWQKSIWLDKPHEGRQEFFERHWQRLNELTDNPYISAHMLVKNMQAFGAEGLIYLEMQANSFGYKTPKGEPIAADKVADIYRKRLAQPDAVATGVTIRLQSALLRFLPHAEAILESQYQFVDQHRDLYVGINMVGREDNDKGYPLRFLSTLRKLRQKIPEVQLAIHAGEVDEPNYHVRDTLYLGAKRIGHGLNLITDPQTMLLMRNSDYLVEINLISNLKLGYVSSYDDHPFAEYLRTGIPVALSTDDRGMWHSNMTDEFFVAVKEFNLSWQEVVGLSRASLQHSFAQPEVKSALLEKFEQKITQFTQQRRAGKSLKNQRINTGEFICGQYKVCIKD